jgi:hypothetical protein
VQGLHSPGGTGGDGSSSGQKKVRKRGQTEKRKKEKVDRFKK